MGELRDRFLRGPERVSDDESTTLQSRLQDAHERGADSVGDATIRDPAALLHHLDVSGHFHRDGRFGRIYHRGMVSLRENVPANSLHVSVEANRMTAHVDHFSPLAVDSDGPSAYSVRRTVLHNLAGMAQDLLWILRGRQGDHRCDLDCEWAASQASEAELLDPAHGAWSVQVEARVRGTLDEARMRAALTTALGDAPLVLIDCPDEGALAAARARLQGTAVTVTASTPLRVCLARHPAGDLLMLSLNHAAADGFSAIRVLEAIAGAYTGDARRRAPLDFLATRDLPVGPATAAPSTPMRAYKRVVERLRDTVDRPARIAADDPRDELGCGFHLVTLSPEATRELVGVRHSRANTNVLMAALHLAIADWNRRHGGVGGRRIGVLVHADLRPEEWNEDPIGNFSVTARMSTDGGDRASPEAALRTITAQIARNKRTRTGVALIAALARAGLLALWAKQSIVVLRPLTGNHLVDTTVLCNLGWLEPAPSFGAGDGEVVELWFSTPARAPLSLCLGAVTSGGRLHLTFRYPHRLFGPDAARRFADCYVEHLRAVAAVAR